MLSSVIPGNQILSKQINCDHTHILGQLDDLILRELVASTEFLQTGVRQMPETIKASAS